MRSHLPPCSRWPLGSTTAPSVIACSVSPSRNSRSGWATSGGGASSPSWAQMRRGRSSNSTPWSGQLPIQAQRPYIRRYGRASSRRQRGHVRLCRCACSCQGPRAWLRCGSRPSRSNGTKNVKVCLLPLPQGPAYDQGARNGLSPCRLEASSFARASATLVDCCSPPSDRTSTALATSSRVRR